MKYENNFHKKAVEMHRDGKFEEAISFFNQALELSPNHPDLLSDRATSYLLLGKFSLALLDFNESAALDANNGYRYASRAYAKEKMNDTAGAIADYEKAIELDPEDAIAMNNLGLLLQYGGNRKASENLFEKADFLAKNQDKNPATNPSETAETPTASAPITKEEITEEEPSKKEVYKSIFTKKGIREFFQFIFNGFKLPK